MQFVEVQKIMQQADNIGWSQEKSQDHSVQIDSSSLPW